MIDTISEQPVSVVRSDQNPRSLPTSVYVTEEEQKRCAKSGRFLSPIQTPRPRTRPTRARIQHLARADQKTLQWQAANGDR